MNAEGVQRIVITQALFYEHTSVTDKACCEPNQECRHRSDKTRGRRYGSETGNEARRKSEATALLESHGIDHQPCHAARGCRKLRIYKRKYRCAVGA